MKYLPLPSLETVTTALNFNTPDANVTGGCEVYTTKATTTDKRLYRNISASLSPFSADLLRLDAPLLSPPEKAALLSSSPELSSLANSPAFGPLSDPASLRVFASLLATLNAAHPHYDFSAVLRPGDFALEPSLTHVMHTVDSALRNVHIPAWGPSFWSCIDAEMALSECTLYAFRPDVDPFAEEAAIWSTHYFFYNRHRKRVAYLFFRVVPVMQTSGPSWQRSEEGVSDLFSEDVAMRMEM